MRKVNFIAIVFLLFLLIEVPLFGYNLKPITSKGQLSNNSITSICQDKRGVLWIGTCDGVNIYNGHNVSLYKPAQGKTLSGNLIDKITETDNNVFWIQTYYGIDKVDIVSNTLEHYDTTSKTIFTGKDANAHFYIIQDNGAIYYYSKPENRFVKIAAPDIVFDDIINFTISADNKIWIFTKTGDFLCYSIHESQQKIELKKEKGYTFANHLAYCFADDDEIFLVDTDFRLYEFSFANRKAVLISNIDHQAAENEMIASIVKFHDDYFIGYKTGGLFIMRRNMNGYALEKVPINSGIFSLIKDRFQDIVWIGTDGQGVYSYSNNLYSITSTRMNDFTFRISRPVRALFLDDANTLWVGSKGDGIVKIHDFDINKNVLDCRIEYLTSSNSQLRDNSVYAFARSKKDIIWIGTEEGLNYYSKKEKAIKRISLSDNGLPIRYIHDVYEQDSVLWIASVGMGFTKAKIRWNGDNPTLDIEKRLVVKNGEMASNYFFSIFPENKDVIWVANRGEGAFRVNTRTMNFEQMKFGSNTLNEINAITKKAKDDYLLATSFGLIKYRTKNDYEIMNKASGFPNSTIHCILSEDDGTYWLSTNSGVVNYNIEKGSFRVFNYLDGLSVVEFSDGAAFRDEKSGTLFFGGTNGFISIQESNMPPVEYMPPIYLDNLLIFGKEQNLNDFRSTDGSNETITLDYSQNFFTVSFMAIDYINGNNYDYQYKIEGLSNQWIDNGNSTSISFIDFAPGEYTLLVKYYNRAIDKESRVYSINIRILPPWYQSGWAYILYMFLFIAAAYAVIMYFIAKSRKKRVRALRIIEQQHKEDIYESKLSFFTNIAHEFCTPLTLIYGPCSRILSQKNVDKSTIRYTRIIQQNAERLNSLIQDLIDFRRIETKYKKPQVESLQLSELVNYIANAFDGLAESSNVRFAKNIQPDIMWNSDKDFLVTILTNLISNAFKYTFKDGGDVTVEAKLSGDNLELSISNSGKGIKEENISRIFDRYSILDDFENQDRSNLWSRNGLGLAISNGMINLLNGKIYIESTLNEWTHFRIILPPLEPDSNILGSRPVTEIKPKINTENDLIVTPGSTNYNDLKPTILVIDDEPEILWLIKDVFADDYNVIIIEQADQATSILKETQPDIIISDVMMENLDGIEFARQLKANSETAHIPLILISAKHEVKEQIEGINAGAELYITKPFNVDYLKSSVKHLITRKETLKDYFSSPLSAFELAEGKLTHKEHKKLLKEIVDIINKNIRNKDLSVNFIATKMNMSSRNLYRKVSEISDLSIADMIRDSRLHIAEDLLIKSKLTIDEIIFKSGFANRVSFFKAFSKKHGCTPKEYRDENGLG